MSLHGTKTHVTPCVGVWIEIRNVPLQDAVEEVTPCVGVWIEILQTWRQQGILLSLPAWECGLKYCVIPASGIQGASHSLRGSVD